MLPEFAGGLIAIITIISKWREVAASCRNDAPGPDDSTNDIRN